MRSDFLVVGSGLTGAVIARTLFDAGRSVIVLERRSHQGGNVHDQLHASGICIHTYGPHYFRTKSEKIWNFVNRFSRFRRFEAIVKSLVDGCYENWPVAASYIRRTVGEAWGAEFTGKAMNFEEASLAMMPRVVYEKYVRGYTQKQWGVPPTALSASLAKRFDVREDDEPRLVRHHYQGIPENGYSNFMRELLRDIPVFLNCNYLKHRDELSARTMTVFTGPIDEYFGFDLGRLKYRGQRREHQYFSEIDWAQPCIQVNNPNPANGAHVRTLEWKHMMPPECARRIRGTVVTREITVTATDPNDYEYPFPDEANAKLYEAYATRARTIPRLMICGRLGEYRYYDMDQAIARAQVLAKRMLEAHSPQRDISVLSHS